VIAFQGTIDRQLLIKAQRVQIARFVPIAVIIAGSALYALASAKFEDPATWGVPLFLLLFAIVTLLSPNLSARAALKTNAALQSPISGWADEQHFVLHSAFAQVDIPWDKMHRVTIRPDMVLLYPSAGQSFILASQFFTTDASWEEFRQLVAAKCKRTHQDRPILKIIMLWVGIIVAVFIIWWLIQRP
jgi:hypothetical protein